MSEKGVVVPVEGAVREAARVVAQHLGARSPRVGIVLGSGLGALSDALAEPVVVPYGEIPGFPAAGVAGHKGELIGGILEGVPVVLQSGRFHLYEGYDALTVALPVRLFGVLGIEILILTNAAGAIRRTFRPPLLMLIADHVNLMWRNPLIGPVVRGEERFPDMSDPYDGALRGLARAAAREAGVPLEEGVYLGLLGPSYETPAEIRSFERIGADAVGMSTVPEVVTARARGIRCLGISIITNQAAGMSSARLDHEDVLDAGKQMGAQLEAVVRGVLRRL